MRLVRIASAMTLTAGLAIATGVYLVAEFLPVVDPTHTGSISGDGKVLETRNGYLGTSLSAFDRGEYDAVRAIRTKLPDDALDARILDWVMARSSRTRMPSGQIRDVMVRLANWPEQKRLRATYERALTRERTRPAKLIEIYSEQPPTTMTGIISLARAHKRMGEHAKARKALAPRWHSDPLDVHTELLILSEFADVLEQGDHRKRFLAMMYRDRIKSAERVASRAGLESFVAPWAASIRKQKNALKQLDKAAEAFKETPHYLFARISYLRRNERDAEAAKLLLQSPISADDLVDPDEWWTERRIVSRDALERGDAESAYKIAAMHRGGSTKTQVEAAFHAGWFALRGLNNAEEAIAHFARIETIATGSISRARGAYWLGRAHDALGSANAVTHYSRAAAHQTTFYGQLARHRLGLGLSPFNRPRVTPDDTTLFKSREPVAAIHRLEAVGQLELARQLAVSLGQSLETAPEVTQLVAHLERRKQRQIALRIAKSAEWRGVETGGLTHPIGAIPASTPIESGERPLAYAIARQESEFNVAARSRANARGLMQLLPGTAREVARQVGVPYKPARLDSDGAYNATLGTAYLNSQLDRFGGSYILTFVAYNAGPGRAREWMKRFGDPRGKPLDEVIDWIEMIPFTETRSYVQRVMENLQVYKARLGQTADIAADLRSGRGS